MGSILAQLIVKEASIILRDQQGRRWSASELLGWCNDGQREIGLLRPDSVTQSRSIAMAIGTEQSLPSDCVRLIDIMYNAGADGAVQGESISLIDRDELDSTAANWRSTGAQADVVHYFYDGRVPKTWHCWPPQAAGGRFVRAAVQLNPTDCTIDGVDDASVSSAIFIDDIYKTALIEYVVHRAYDKNDETRDTQRAEQFYQRFLRRLGLKSQVDVGNDPNHNAPPAQQSRQAGGVSPRARPNG